LVKVPFNYNWEYASANRTSVVAEGLDMFRLGVIGNFGWMDVWELNPKGWRSLWLKASAT
jgi:hypothetical protein